MWDSIGQQWKKQEWGSGVLTPACSIVQPHPGAWVHAHGYHLAPKQQSLCQHPREGDQKEKMHDHCDSHTGHLGKDGGRYEAQLWAQLILIPRSCLAFSSKDESGGRSLSFVPYGSSLSGIHQCKEATSR